MILTLIGASDIYLKMHKSEYSGYSHFCCDWDTISHCFSREIRCLGPFLLHFHFETAFCFWVYMMIFVLHFLRLIDFSPGLASQPCQVKHFFDWTHLTVKTLVVIITCCSSWWWIFITTVFCTSFPCDSYVSAIPLFYWQLQLQPQTNIFLNIFFTFVYIFMIITVKTELRPQRC